MVRSWLITHRVFGSRVTTLLLYAREVDRYKDGCIYRFSFSFFFFLTLHLIIRNEIEPYRMDLFSSLSLSHHLVLSLSSRTAGRNLLRPPLSFRYVDRTDRRNRSNKQRGEGEWVSEGVGPFSASGPPHSSLVVALSLDPMSATTKTPKKYSVLSRFSFLLSFPLERNNQAIKSTVYGNVRWMRRE